MINPEARSAPRSIEEDAGDVFLARLLHAGPDTLYEFLDHFETRDFRKNGFQPDHHTWLAADGRAFAVQGEIGNAQSKFRVHEYDATDEKPAWKRADVYPRQGHCGQVVTTTLYFEGSGILSDAGFEPLPYNTALHERVLRGLAVLALKEQADPVHAITFGFDQAGRVRPFLVEGDKRQQLADGSSCLDMLLQHRRLAALEARLLKRQATAEAEPVAVEEPARHLQLVEA